MKSKIANLKYHTNNNITSNERVLAWSDKEPTNNMNLKILILTLICIPLLYSIELVVCDSNVKTAIKLKKSIR